MNRPSDHFLSHISSRGVLAQITHEEEFIEHLAAKGRTAYVGYDPTADSLQAGHLVPTLMLARWQRYGGRAIIVMGSGTALVGDPSGKTDMRKMLTREEIESNKQKMKKQLERFIDLSSPARGIVVDNADWLAQLNYLNFLRDVGPHFSVNRMLTADSVKLRMEKGLSFLEFNYMLLQAYDFLHLFREEGCTVQLGGDDQWSNMLGGMELVRRMHREPAFCVTTSLLTTSDGRKMGKTEKGALWLDPEKTSAYEFYQYWRNIEDSSVGKVMRMLTFIELAEVQGFEALSGADVNRAKEHLALEMTRLVHGEDAAKAAQETARALFAGAQQSGALEAPTFSLDRARFGEGMPAIEMLTVSGVFASKSEVRRLAEQGGLQIGPKKVNDPQAYITQNEAEDDGSFLVKKGKKHYFRIVFCP